MRLLHTKYSWDYRAGVEMSVEEIVAKASTLGARGHVVIAGGEPLIWRRGGLDELARALRAKHRVGDKRRLRPSWADALIFATSQADERRR